ncbi:Hsp70 family protein [Enterovirga rhinocerotis]|uniref:Putative chaperone protein n=1 Tax=Enterovirga rhinocerotis TaxID=1339210 RepID=A0A4R7BNE4_9HYPH|nr:Hsp70 family protein [Enterovirga rhinocerotis]TDR85456.1 putative chaperone protein [Enterovirga rhinocerotis]
MSACGLDFGTSNTTLGVIRGGEPRLLPLEGDEDTIPSAIFFARGAAPIIGRAGIAAYVEGLPGRLMRSLKSVLGKPLLEETTPVGRERLTFRRVIAVYLAEVKRRAEEEAGRPLDSVVHGRPVHFVDGDPEGDRKAEEALAAIAREIGFRDISFAYEPIAAALDYERRLDREEIALIADIGGGTSDFSIVRLGPERRAAPSRAEDILANDGIRIGGTDFDRLLSLRRVMPELGLGSPAKRAGLDVPSSYFHELATWSSINRLYDPKVRREVEEVRRDAARPELIERLLAVLSAERGHTLAMEVEQAKIDLSGLDATRLPLDWIEAGLAVDIDREGLREATGILAERLRERIGDCIRQAGLRPDAIDALFLTGGSTRLRHARAAIRAAVPDARVVEGNTFGSVGLGLTIEAARRYGTPARLAETV